MTNEVTGKCHPACELLPEMTEDEYRALVEDMREHGQRHPIIVDESGVILDGRHRWRACQKLGVEPQVRQFEGDDAAKLALILSENFHRRHMTKGQRAMVMALLRPEAKMGRGSDEEKVARNVGLSLQRIRLARAVLAWSEETARAVLTGAVSLDAAHQQMLEERQVERPAPPPPAEQHRMCTDPEAHEQAKKLRQPKKPIEQEPLAAALTREVTQVAAGLDAQSWAGIEGIDYELKQNRQGYMERQPISSLEGFRIAVREARDAGHSEDELMATLSEVLADYAQAEMAKTKAESSVPQVITAQ
jgi:ParB-like chromosome segregation protein Spo0J